MAAFDALFADPGGQYYSGLGVTAAGVWNGAGASGSISSSAPAGRATTYALALGGANVTRSIASFASLIVGAAVYCSALPITGSGVVAIQLLDSATVQVDVRVTAAGQLQITRNGTVLATSTNLLVPSTWNYIEFKAIIASGTGGSAEVRVNGVSWVSVSSANTQNSTNASANQVKLAGFNSSGNCYYKDIYILADTGTGPFTTYLGDITVAILTPSGAGVNATWTPNGAATDWQCVNDATPDGDTTYISDATAGDKADFAHTALSLTGSILSVIMVGYMRKDDAGSRQAANMCLSGGTESDGATQSLSNTYQYYYDVLDKDPHTSAAWTLTNLNNATFGVKEIS